VIGEASSHIAGKRTSNWMQTSEEALGREEIRQRGKSGENAGREKKEKTIGNRVRLKISAEKHTVEKDALVGSCRGLGRVGKSASLAIGRGEDWDEFKEGERRGGGEGKQLLGNEVEVGESALLGHRRRSRKNAGMSR